MKQIYFLFVVLLVVMTACGGKKEASVDAEQLMFQIDSVDHVTGLSADHLRHFILEGVVFDEEKTREGKNIILAASVSYPQTDLYIPFSITITPEGKMSISKNEDMEELPPMLGDSLN